MRFNSERQPVPITSLESDAAVANGEEAAPTPSLGVAPFEDRDFSSIVKHIGSADHLRHGEFESEHIADRFVALDWWKDDLLVHAIGVVKFRKAVGISSVEPVRVRDPGVSACWESQLIARRFRRWRCSGSRFWRVP